MSLSSVSCRLVDPVFYARLMEWLRTLGADKFATFMRGGVASRLDKPEFVEVAFLWLSRLVAEEVMADGDGETAGKLFVSVVRKMPGHVVRLHNSNFLVFLSKHWRTWTAAMSEELNKLLGAMKPATGLVDAATWKGVYARFHR